MSPRRSASLPVAFLWRGGLLLLIATVGAGSAVVRLVSNAAIEHNAASTAVLIQSIVSPAAEDLQKTGAISDISRHALDELMLKQAVRSRFHYLEIWLKGGTVAYSNSAEIIGRTFAPVSLTTAFGGKVVSSYADLSTAEHTERGFGTRYLEIYTPIRAANSDEVIAVAEVHEVPTALMHVLARVRWMSWTIVGLSAFLILLGLYGIVRRGGRTIDAQHATLEARAREAEQMAQANRLLRERLQYASARTTELNEDLMRNLGADLHDGPAQLVSFAQLKLTELVAAQDGDARKAVGDKVQAALAEALREIRSIASGALLPELARLPVYKVARKAAEAHANRTSTHVALNLDLIDVDVADAVRVSVYRFVQEGLNNAFRHAAGAGQAVDCVIACKSLEVRVRSRRADIEPPEGDRRLGLIGLRERIQSLGGSFEFLQSEDETIVSMRLELDGGLLASKTDERRDHR